MVDVNRKENIFWKRWLIVYLILLLIVSVAGWFVTGFLSDKARQEILKYNESEISSHTSHLTAEFEKIERAVKLLSGSPSILPALVSRKEQDIKNADAALDRYNLSMNSSVSYLMDSSGKTIASSNRNDSDNFVGKSYQFRPYFTQAIKGASGRYFALGSTSLKRGFYASYPVRDGKGNIVGVAVIKQDVDAHEAHLIEYPYCFVVDPNGIIFLSGINEMKFKSLWPVSRETKLALLESKQFGEREFDSVLQREVEDGMEITLNGRNYLASRKFINSEGWSIVLMTTTERIYIYKSVGVIITILICTFLIVPLVINYNTSKSAELVRESEMRYRQLFERNLAGVYRTTIDGRLLDCNDAFALMYGFDSRDEAIQRPVEDFFISSEARQKFISALQKGGVLLDFESQGRRKDGSLIWVLENAALVPDAEGGPTEIEGTLVDITERKQTEEAVLQERNFAQAAVDSLPGLFYLFDEQGKFLRWNKNFEETSGYSAGEIVRMSPLDLFDEPDKKIVAAAIQKAFITGQASVEADFLAKDKT
ncbi:MAG: PAS domain S-box protein, partial [Desulfobacterales bacterium]